MPLASGFTSRLTPGRLVALGCLAPLAFCLLLCGCGGGESYELVTVSGRVTLDGEPLANVRVGFQPASGKADPGPGSAGVTEADGRYTLRVVSASNKKGAVPGKHIVRMSVVSEQDSADDADTSMSSSLPPGAGNGSLSFEVPVDGTDGADFELTSK
jgi:hypothetical protein